MRTVTTSFNVILSEAKDLLPSPGEILRSLRSLKITTLVYAIWTASQPSTANAQLHPRPTREPVAIRLDARFDALMPPGTRIEKIVDGHDWTEGPVWVRDGGYLLFSDVVKNAIYRWKESEGESVFLWQSGYSAPEPFAGPEPGSNGLAIDPQGRLIICQHGNRRISRREPDGSLTVLVDRYRGKRLNSPNDLVFKSNGDLYFTDPPFGLPRDFNDSAKELPFQGVYRLDKKGRLTLLTKDLRAPNGLAFSPDERTLYVSNAEATRLVWMAYAVRPDGTLGRGRVFYDGTAALGGRRGTADGMKVDVKGNLFSVGPGGIYVFAPDGTLLGWLDFGGNVGNVAWGEGGSTLFIASNAVIYRVRLSTIGAGYEPRRRPI
jgi:gluconolactonase